MNDKHYQCLVFDWDGTLIDSIASIVASLQFASKSVCNIEVTETSAQSVIGLGLSEAIEQLHPELEKVRIEDIAQAYKQHYLYDNPIQASLFEGVTDLLDELIESGYTLAIATGKSRQGLDRSLEEHKLGHYFTTTRCAGEVKSKPHPEMLLGILEEFKLSPEQILMIGDSEHDLMMANNAQVKSIAVSHGVQQADVLLQYKPLACLDRITDLSDYLSHNLGINN